MHPRVFLLMRPLSFLSYLLVLYIWPFCLVGATPNTVGGAHPSSPALPQVQVHLQVDPVTHAFSCRYRVALPAADTTTQVLLHLNRAFTLHRVRSPHAVQRLVTTVPYAGDTVRRLQLRYAPRSPRARWIELTYAGTMTKGEFTDHVTVFSGHSNWLPFRPYGEYELVHYELTVQVPPDYQVRSTVPAHRPRPGQWVFRGTTSAIEPTALIARQFYQTVSTTSPSITLVKTGVAPTRVDTLLLHQTESVVAYYNRTIGREDPIKQFTIFLPGTNNAAYGLLANATVITYSTFDVTDKRDALIVAHEISHKWWAYGSFHDENGWLSEAFATYSSLLYIQAQGDEAGYQAELARLAETAVGAPPLWGFNRYKHPFPMYRRVIYNKGTGILAALHRRVGTDTFLKIMAQTAAQKTSTTLGFLATVDQIAGSETHSWLLQELKR